MSDESEQTEEAISEDHDALLQLICSMGQGGLELGMTLYVNGVVVSGILIDRRKYLEKWIQMFGTTPDDFVDELRDAFGLDEPEAEPAPAHQLRYIHLKDARIFAPGGPPLPSNGLLWRGKIKDVNGFSMGFFQTQD